MKLKKKEKEFFDIFNELSPILQDYLIQTGKSLLETQDKIQAANKIEHNKKE